MFSILFILLPLLALVYMWARTPRAVREHVSFGSLFLSTVGMVLALCACGEQPYVATTVEPTGATTVEPTPVPTPAVPRPALTLDVKGKYHKYFMDVPTGAQFKEMFITFKEEVDENTFLDACVDMEHTDYFSLPSGTGASKWYWEATGTHTIRVHGNTLIPGTWKFSMITLRGASLSMESYYCK